MAKRENQLETDQITLAATPQVCAYLRALVGTGLYGKNRSEAAYRLVENGLKALLADGTLARSLLDTLTTADTGAVPPGDPRPPAQA